MDLRKIKTLIDLVSESNIAELEITETEGTVRIVKSQMPSALATPPVGVQLPAASQVHSVVVEAAPEAQPDVTPATSEPATANHHLIKSPMVGTFYNASSPDAKPFVSVGDTVKQGQTVCIIEAMKIMNEIEADRAGTILRVLTDTAQAVEYGQPLFEIA